MSLLTYIFSTILLSWAGLSAYWLLRYLRPAFAARKTMLWMILVLSLLLPLTPPFTQTNYRHIEARAEKGTNGALIISPVEVGASSVQEFCHCAKPHAGDVILYQTSRIYDFLLRNQTILLCLLTGTGFLLMLRMFVQLGMLMRKVRRYGAETVEIEGKKVQMVRDMPGLSAASLRLFGKFIFWNNQLDLLPTEEQRAILLHEYSHLKQRNSHEKIFLAVLQIFWWVNPAFYVISKEMELLSEFVADDYAVNKLASRKHYAGLLLRLKTGEAFAPLQFFKGSKLKLRVECILKPEKSAKMQLAPALGLWLVLTLPGEMIAKSIVKEQLRDIEVYEFLTERNQQTGQKEFCRKCTYDLVEQCYMEEVPCEEE